MIDLDELEKLEREATPGPWKIAITKFPSGDSGWEYQLSTERGHAATRYSDFALIVAARNALLDLLAELRTLRARVTELERDARLGAVVREAVGCMNAYMVEGHTTAPGFTLRQERIISVHQLNVLRAIADALRAEESAMTPEDRRERGRR